MKQKLDLVTVFSQECHMIGYDLDGSIAVSQIDSLTSDHEEADRRMLSHITKIMEDKPSS